MTFYFDKSGMMLNRQLSYNDNNDIYNNQKPTLEQRPRRSSISSNPWVRISVK